MMLGPHSIVLFCRDTEACRAFYEAVGFRWLRGFEGMHWFALGAAEVMLHPSDTDPGPGAPQLYASAPDVDALFARCRDAGLGPHHHQVDGALVAPHTTPWGTREFDLLDPAGHRWGFVQRVQDA